MARHKCYCKTRVTPIECDKGREVGWDVLIRPVRQIWFIVRRLIGAL